MQNHQRAIGKSPNLFTIIVLCVIGVFLANAIHLAQTLPSRLDEGAFLIKGFDFLTGKYTPFQDYGPWTNNMPLAYFIPGLVQAFFGPGLLAARVFMILLAFLNFLGMALLVNRFCGRWWALGVALALSANQALVGLYVQAISQGIVAFLVTWALFFLLGEDRKLWQLGLAALLCSLATLTRQNMVFLLPFVVVYGFWLHGRQAGWIALTAASIPFIVVHIIYFPQIIDI